jgi:hypothetical protein
MAFKSIEELNKALILPIEFEIEGYDFEEYESPTDPNVMVRTASITMAVPRSVTSERLVVGGSPLTVESKHVRVGLQEKDLEILAANIHAVEGQPGKFVYKGPGLKFDISAPKFNPVTKKMKLASLWLVSASFASTGRSLSAAGRAEALKKIEEAYAKTNKEEVGG